MRTFKIVRKLPYTTFTLTLPARTLGPGVTSHASTRQSAQHTTKSGKKVNKFLLHVFRVAADWYLCVSVTIVMASAPLWNQSYDRNRSRLSEIDSFLNSGTSAWKREGGDRGLSATNSLALNGVHHSSDTESKPDQLSGTGQKMAASVPDDPIYKVGESTGAPRPLKSLPKDRITSITENPFYKSFGVKHPRSPRDVPSMPSFAKMSTDTDGRSVLREELGEYKPGSGFVHKLMGKFASMGVREEPLSLHHIKHASSVDDILDGTESQHSEADAHHQNRGRLKFSTPQYRARSVESISRRKAPPVPNLAVPLRHIDRKWERPTSPTKSPRESHIIAPDVELAREDIILIENPPPQPSENENSSDEGDGKKAGVHVSSFKDDVPTDELPKPNTVSTVRSLFETGLPLSPTSNQSAEPFSGDSEPMCTPRDSVLTPRDTIVTPRDVVLTPRDSNSTPRDMVSTPRDTVLTPRDSNLMLRESKPSQPQSPRVSADVSQRYDASKSRFSWTSDVKTAGNVAFPSSSAPPPLPSTIPPFPAVSSAAEAKGTDTDTSENVKPSLFHVSSGAENRPLASPRSTAAVKAVPASRPAIPARPSRPASNSASSSGASVPPSFTPSIKKTSPVMPVAPFKENKMEEGDGNRHLIYAKRNTGTRPQKGVRVKDYSEVSVDPAADTIKKSEEEVIKVDNNHDVRKTNKMNRAHTKGRAPPIPKRRPPSEESPVQSPRSPETNDNQWTDLLKPTSPRIEDSQPEPVTLVPVEPPRPSKAPRTFFPQPEGESSADLERKQTVSLSVPEEMKMETEDIKTEETKTETTESDEPVRGIPSIIAKRLKQNAQNQNADSATQSRPPGELFGVVLGKTRHEDDSAEGASEIPCKRLTPAAEKPAKDTTSNLPSEIENQIASVRKRMEQGSKNKPSGPSIIFDSSQLHKKRREKQAAKSSAQVGVPPLDLSGITSEDSSNAGSIGGYRVTPREIKPCNIEFIGGNVSIGRSMLEKKRSVKVR